MHPCEAAIILGKILPDTSTLVATLLHDVPEDTSMTLEPPPGPPDPLLPTVGVGDGSAFGSIAAVASSSTGNSSMALA